MAVDFYFSKTRLFVIFGIWILITVLVGLLVGLLVKNCDEDMATSQPEATTTQPETTTTSKFPSQGDGPWMDPFLPSYAYPTEYNMWFKPDFYFDGSTFKGKENITIHFTDKSKYIIVHYKMMNITKTRVFSTSGEERNIKQTFSYEPHQFWVTELEREIEDSEDVILYLEFEGSLANGIVGYYKSTYVNANTGVQSWLATTKFQPTDARKAFPNFDEPKFKANFTITLHHWQNFTALSNMPNKTQLDIDNVWRETNFETTPRMSSYLVCFIVCDFMYKETTLPSGQPSRVWTSADKIDQVDYALKITTNITDYFEKEFDMQYHLPKLDQVAVPDYPSGATEHWGLITYREARLLFDQKEAGAADKQGVAEIVAHELAHNYFGNVITCKWWDDIWLNEGFASYFGDKSLRNIEPEFEMEDHFVITTTQPIMVTDAEVASRAIRENVTSPDEINQAFSGVVYSKGAAFLRMTEATLDEFKPNLFRDILRNFLKKHEYDVVTTEDFLNAVQEGFTKIGLALSASDLLRPWIEEMGFPVLNITQEGDSLTLTQQRFVYASSGLSSQRPSPYGYEWTIPVSYYDSNGTVVSNFMRDTTVTLQGISDPWVKFNPGQIGFYRVNYPTSMWQALADQLKSNHVVFRPIDRAQILDDAFNLARAAQLEFPIALDLTMYMPQETHYFAWSTVDNSLSYISMMLMNDAGYALWRKYIQFITNPIMKLLQVEDKGSYLDILNRRNNIIPMACSHGNKECIENTTALFLEWINNNDYFLSPNLRMFVYRYGMKQAGDEVIWDKVWDRYVNASGQEKTNLVACLASTNKLWLIQKFLDYAMDPNKIKSQDFFTVINYISVNADTNRYLWDWARANYQALVDRFGTADRYFGRMIPTIVAMYNTEFQLKEVTDFYSAYRDAGAGLGPRIFSIMGIQSNIAWVKANKQPILQWLMDNQHKFNI